jgi:hypothetical protein
MAIGKPGKSQLAWRKKTCRPSTITTPETAKPIAIFRPGSDGEETRQRDFNANRRAGDQKKGQ